MLPSRGNCRDLTNTSCNYSEGTSKTPSSVRSHCGTKPKTPGSGKSGKTPLKGASVLTPSRNCALTLSGKKTPTGGGDRFIPNRSATDFDLAHYLATTFNDSSHNASTLSLQQLEYQRKVSETLNGGVTAPRDAGNDSSGVNENFRVLAYQKKPPAAPEGYANSHRALYTTRITPASSCKRSTMRHIPPHPERILDAPSIGDDFYLNILDWSSTNLLAVALYNSLYIWNAATGDIELLTEFDEGSGDYVASVAWINTGNVLGVGGSNGSVMLWNVETKRQLRSMSGHTERVGCLSWNNHILSSGSRSGVIHHHDVRVAEHQVGVLQGHSQEVCGLKWSPNQRYLASGGNDNIVNIWSSLPNALTTESTPHYTLTDHQAAVKALAWCPWQHSILATGGGTADRHIRIWNCNTGTSIKSVDAQSQVCSILWSKEYKEIISGHGYPNHELAIWKYPDMQKITELTGHTSRVLQLAMSPNEEMVVSASSDESLRIWQCFGVDPATKERKARAKSGAAKPPRGTLPRTIR